MIHFWVNYPFTTIPLQHLSIFQISTWKNVEHVFPTSLKKQLSPSDITINLITDVLLNGRRYTALLSHALDAHKLFKVRWWVGNGVPWGTYYNNYLYIWKPHVAKHLSFVPEATNDIEEEHNATAYHNTGAIYNKSPESQLIQSQNIWLKNTVEIEKQETICGMH